MPCIEQAYSCRPRRCRADVTTSRLAIAAHRGKRPIRATPRCRSDLLDCAPSPATRASAQCPLYPPILLHDRRFVAKNLAFSFYGMPASFFRRRRERRYKRALSPPVAMACRPANGRELYSVAESQCGHGRSQLAVFLHDSIRVRRTHWVTLAKSRSQIASGAEDICKSGGPGCGEGNKPNAK
jgi:hypothetical protein